MFSRIMTVVLAAILVMAICFGAISFVVLRNRQIDARLEYLTSEAEDIAYLAASQSGSSGGFFYSTQTGSRQILNRKADKVNQEFGAYIAVVDRRGRVMDNVRTAYSEDPDFVASLDSSEITDALNKVLQGETIRVQSTIGGSPTFTVGVPFIRNGIVEGAVLIQTKAQRIESGLSQVLWRIALITLGVLVLSGVAVGLYVRSVIRPLNALTDAAGAVAGGDFSVRLDENSGDRQLREVTAAFNTMNAKLQGVESSRREFVANVSHELRSPITSIRGFAEGMADGVIPEEERPKYMRLVADESKRLGTLVDDLLALSRLERDDVKPDYSVFDINEMLRRAIIRRMNDLDAKELDVDCGFRMDPCYVNADSDRIEQVVINLLDNAIKFTPSQGRIDLETEPDGNDIAVTVRDNGPGVPPGDRDKVFDRFFTADRAHTSGKGTGLGLSICKRIMEMHGKDIALLDTDSGAAFRFTLQKATDQQTEEFRHGQDTAGMQTGD